MTLSKVLISDGATFCIPRSAYWNNWPTVLKLCCYLQVTNCFCSLQSHPVNIWNSISSMSLVENLNFTYIIVFDFLGFKCGDLWLTEKGWPLLSNEVSLEHCIRTEQIAAGFKPRRLYCGRDQLQSICLYRFQPTGGSFGPVLWTYVQASHFPNKFFCPLRMILRMYWVCRGFLFLRNKIIFLCTVWARYVFKTECSLLVGNTVTWSHEVLQEKVARAFHSPKMVNLLDVIMVVSSFILFFWLPCTVCLGAFASLWASFFMQLTTQKPPYRAHEI